MVPKNSNFFYHFLSFIEKSTGNLTASILQTRNVIKKKTGQLRKKKKVVNRRLKGRVTLED